MITPIRQPVHGLIALIFGFAGAGAAEASAAFTTHFDQATGQLQVQVEPGRDAARNFVVACELRNFQTKTAFEPGPAMVVRQDGPSIAFQSAIPAQHLRLTHRVVIQPDHVTWTIAPEPGGSTEPLLLEMGLRVALPFGAESCTYWDGFKEVKAPRTVRKRDKWVGNFPLASVCTESGGVALGMAATDLVSYLEHGLTPAQAGIASMSCGTRLVVDGKMAESVTFVFFPFDPEYGGFKAALQQYYDLYPACFTAKAGVNPRLQIGSCCNITWVSGRTDGPPINGLSLERVRRFYGDWAWAYAPFRRTGDIYGEHDLWDYLPARPFETIKATSWTWEKFHEFRRERFASLHGEVANCLHHGFMWCEQQLVKEKFPDAQVTPEMDPDATTVYNQPWVTGHDNEFKVFPYKTSYEPFLKEGLRKTSAEIDLAGWAFDCGEDVGKYRGPAMDRCPGRAFDDQGTYVDVAVAMADLMDYMHTLKGRRHPLGIIGNFGFGVFPIAFRTDAVIYENPPYTGTDNVALVRYFSGHKTICWWRDYDIDRLLPWESMTPAEIREAFLAARDNVLLASFNLGGIPPSNFLAGVPRLLDYMPTLLETVTTGWEPQVPVKAHPKLWLARYGRDVNTILCLGNPTVSKITDEVKICNRLLGDFSYAWVSHEGRDTIQEIDGEFTTLPASDIPARTPLILNAQVGLKAPGKIKVVVTQERTCYETITQMSLDSDRAFSSPVVLRQLPEQAVHEVFHDDKRVTPWLPAGNQVSGKLDFPAGTSRLKIVQRSRLFQSPESTLRAFPVLRDNREPDCVIVYAADDPEAKALAERCQAYFQFYGQTRPPYAKLEIPVLADSEAPMDRNRIIIDVGNRSVNARQSGLPYTAEPKVMVQSHGAHQVLYICGPDQDAVREALLRLFRVWDNVYKFYGHFPDTTYLYMYQRPDGNYAAKQAGLVGKLLE